MRDDSFRFILTFTLVYGIIALGLLAAQPKSGIGQAADAAGNLEVAGDFRFFKARVASAE